MWYFSVSEIIVLYFSVSEVIVWYFSVFGDYGVVF